MFPDDEDEFDDQDEFAPQARAEALRKETYDRTRGQEDRAFFDGLAKQEDERHHRARRERDKLLLVIGEARQKLRHKQEELRAIEDKIRMEEDTITLEGKREYRREAKALTLEKEGVVPVVPTGIESGVEGAHAVVDSELLVARAMLHVKDLEAKKADLLRVLSDMKSDLSGQERTLSQLEHQVARM